jgi:predicted TIM-barrel fold metal-dependent hydrolase
MQRLLARHPRLPIIVAHMGAPEVVRFLRLAEDHERVRLDTTMVFTDFFGAPYPDSLLPRLADLQPKILLGTDFPTIPYPYVHQLDGLAKLELGDDWLRAVCWGNGVELFGLTRGQAAT